MDSGYSFDLTHEPNLAAKAEAYPFQREAVAFVTGRTSSAVFHEQGLGKTKIAIDVALSWLGERAVDTVLIFTKKGLVGNWEREFRIHTHVRPFVISEVSRKNYFVFTTPARVVLAHFEAARKEERRFSAWLSTRRVAVIVDEAAKLKNPDAEITKAFFRLSSKFARRVIMTGTPAANRPYDVWAPVFFLDGGTTLGTDYPTFKRDLDIDKGLRGDPAGLAAYGRRLADARERLARISVRETKDGGRIALPGKEFVRVDCDWEPAQAELYRQVREELRAVVLRDGQLVEEDQDAILRRLLRLLQVCSNPRVVDDSYQSEPGKFQPLYDLLTDVTRVGEKALVFTQFVGNANWLAARLSGFGALLLTGETSIQQRYDAVEAFMSDPGRQVLVATVGAAKEGLTLTSANHVVFFDRGYSLEEYLQAQDRIHRVSQTKTCYVYNLMMRDSVDEWIEALLQQKHLAAQTVQGDIPEKSYLERADFSFVDILNGILG